MGKSLCQPVEIDIFAHQTRRSKYLQVLMSFLAGSNFSLRLGILGIYKWLLPLDKLITEVMLKLE